MFAGISALFGEVLPLLAGLKGLEYSDRLGDPLINVLEAKLKVSAATVGQKAIAQHYVDKFVALSSAVNTLTAIAQPSSEDQARLVVVQAELNQLEQKLSV